MYDDRNNSKTFIVGIVIFVLLVIGGFAFFAKKGPVGHSPAVTSSDGRKCVQWVYE